eukprot:s1504_g8.t1
MAEACILNSEHAAGDFIGLGKEESGPRAAIARAASQPDALQILQRRAEELKQSSRKDKKSLASGLRAWHAFEVSVLGYSLCLQSESKESEESEEGEARSEAASLAAFVCFLSQFHNRLHLLTAEFIFAQTDGSVLIWPADFQLQLGPCAVFLATGGTLSLLSSFVLLHSHAARRTRKEDTVQRARRPPLHRSKTSTRAAGELLFEASVLKMKSHDRRIVAAVLVAMTLLALLLGLMAFLLGRGGVEDGVSKAFRGPQDGVRRTALVAQAISHAVGGSTRMLGRGIGVVVTSFAGAVFQKAAAGAHVLVAVVNPCHRMLQHAVFQAFSGRAALQLSRVNAANAAAQSPAAAAKVVPESRVTQEAHGSFMERLRGGKVLRISDDVHLPAELPALLLPEL